MGYYYNKNGNLVFSKSYVAPSRSTRTTHTTTPKVTTDIIRPQSLYVESSEHVENGNLVQWTGQAAMFSSTGQKVNQFTSQNGHEFALSQVEKCDEIHSKKVAGVVIEHAASPEDSSFLHRGVHSHHQVSDNQHIHRLATSGSVVLAWVMIDDHENCLDGVYTQFINGVESGIYCVRELGEEHFSMERIGSNSSIDELAQSVDTLTERFNSLTSG